MRGPGLHQHPDHHVLDHGNHDHRERPARSQLAQRGVGALLTRSLACLQVGYGEHYPGYWPGQIACAFCMMSGIFVLALPMNVIGVAFEETIREENRFKAERERRLKLMLLKRKTQTGESYDASEQALADRVRTHLLCNCFPPADTRAFACRSCNWILTG